MIDQTPCGPGVLFIKGFLFVIFDECEIPFFAIDLQLTDAVGQMNKVSARRCREAACNANTPEFHESAIERILDLRRRPLTRSEFRAYPGHLIDNLQYR